jgi:hypothetical protein
VLGQHANDEARIVEDRDVSDAFVDESPHRQQDVVGG